MKSCFYVFRLLKLFPGPRWCWSLLTPLGSEPEAEGDVGTEWCLVAEALVTDASISEAGSPIRASCLCVLSGLVGDSGVTK